MTPQTSTLIFGVALIVGAYAVPSFDINLDLAPEARWANVTRHYRDDMIAMMSTWSTILQNKFSQEEQGEWSKVIKATVRDEYLAELQGMVDDLDNPAVTLETVLAYNSLYEMGSPTMCSGVLAASADGEVIHGRNMDYKYLFQLPDGTTHDWPDVTFDTVFWRDGKKLMTTVSWPFFNGIHTGMRFDGWTFEQNTRSGGLNNATLNLAAAKQGGAQFAWSARHVMETIPHFEDAVQKFYATNFMAPQYFIMSGAAPFEGAVLTIDRGGQISPDTPLRRIENRSATWHLLQTNDDATRMPLDPRRPLTEVLLGSQEQDSVSVDFVWKMIRAPTLFNPFTAFTWVASPKTGYHHTLIHSESPEMLAGTQEAEEVLLQQSQPLKTRPRSKWAHRVTGSRMIPM